MKKLTLLFTVLFAAIFLDAQNVAINNDGTLANSSAMLDVKSTTKGFMMPRMTSAQRGAIVSPVLGLLVFDTDTKTIWAYNGSSWINLSSAGGGGSLTLPFSQSASLGGTAFNISNTGNAIVGSSSTNQSGIIGNNTNTGIGGIGVTGTASSTSGIGVYGQNSEGTGVFGSSANGVGVKASSTSGLALQVNGNLKISGGNTNPGNGAVLTSDASGNATWKQPLAMSKTAFSVRGYNNALEHMPANSRTTVHLKTEEFDYGNNYNAYSGTTPSFGHSVFVVPKNGVYHFDATIGLQSNDNEEVFLATLVLQIITVVNGATVTIDGATTEFSSGMRSLTWMGEARISKDIRLKAGDIVQLQIVNYNEIPYELNGYAYTEPHFGCHLVFED